MNALTFDIDWAPDVALEYLRRKLRRHGLLATFLATHQTEMLDQLRDDGHDLGIHPNFSAGSTHGASTSEIMRTMFDLVPDASVVRTHGLVQSSRLLAEIAVGHPQLELDLSLFTYRARHCEKTAFHFATGVPPLRRLNYNWEDDIAFVDPAFDPSRFLPWGEDHIFDFHPIHIYLNSAGPKEYQRLKGHLGQRSLTSATESEMARFRNDGFGIESYFDSLIGSGMQFEKLVRPTPVLIAS